MSYSRKFAVFSALFWLGWGTSLLAFFEQCLDNGTPFWSSVLGAPFLHHGYYCFAISAAGWFVLVIPWRRVYEFLKR